MPASEKWNGRNLQEEMAHRFRLSNSDCLADPRIARLLKFKIALEQKIATAQAANVRPLGKAAGYSDEELEHIDSRILQVLKSIRDSQRFLTVLSPKQKKQPTKEKLNG